MLNLFFSEQCDIDEILRRAETRDEAPSMAGDELLSAFKVASFNLDEEEEVSKLDSIADESTKDWVRCCFLLVLFLSLFSSSNNDGISHNCPVASNNR